MIIIIKIELCFMPVVPIILEAEAGVSFEARILRLTWATKARPCLGEWGGKSKSEFLSHFSGAQAQNFQII